MPRCPKCKTPTDLIKYEGVPIYNCGFCGGHWVTKVRLDVILRRREVDMPPAVRQKMIEIADASNSTETLWCINCGRRMIKESFKHWPEIQIDRCDRCQGIWLDRGELEKCQIFWEHMKDCPDSDSAQRAEHMALLEAEWTKRLTDIKQEAEEA